jgi:hypothetical protein
MLQPEPPVPTAEEIVQPPQPPMPPDEMGAPEIDEAALAALADSPQGLPPDMGESTPAI